MATSPNFSKTPRIGVGAVTVANTARDGTGTLVTVGTADATFGSRLHKIVVQATGDPDDSTVTVFFNDGVTSWLFDEFDLGNQPAASNTVVGYRTERTYDLDLPAGWSVEAGVTVVPTSGQINVFTLLGDFDT